jgi:hypothetical protein
MQSAEKFIILMEPQCSLQVHKPAPTGYTVTEININTVESNLYHVILFHQNQLYYYCSPVYLKGGLCPYRYKITLLLLKY